MGRLDAKRYKALHQASGETIRWLKAIPVPVGTAGRQRDNVLLKKQTIPAQARFLVSSTTEDYESAEFGLIGKGTMQISAFPDWARFNHLDRVLLLAPGRLLSTMERVTRGSSSEDTLPIAPVKSITGVWVEGTEVSDTHYEAVDEGIKWLYGAPSEGDEYAVEYIYAPRYIVLPQTQRTSPTDMRGSSLPLHYWLQRERSYPGGGM